MSENITRPIVGIENRTAQEVFDIMVARIGAPPAPQHISVGSEPVAWTTKGNLETLASTPKEARYMWGLPSGSTISVPLYSSPQAPAELVVPDFRALAVEIVDRIRGYTYEHSGSPDAHLADYDIIEERLSDVFAGKPVSCIWDCVDAPMDVCPTTGIPCPSRQTPPPVSREGSE